MSRLVTLADGRQIAINNLDITIDELSIKVRDAFYRLKVAIPFSLLDLKQTSPASALFYDSAQIAGGGTSIAAGNLDRASTTISVSANTAGHRVLQTRQRTNYQPGKAQTILMSAIVKTGQAVKRIGYFDEKNGVFFEFVGTTIFLCIRSSASGSVVTKKIPQSEWNGNKIDGSTGSAYNINLNAGAIFGISLEWLGVGTVFFFVFHNGELILLHAEHHDNIVTSVYMSTAVLPLRYEIQSDGLNTENDNLEIICASVTSEGGVEKNGANRSVSRGNSLFITANTVGVYYPLISLRINSLYKSTEIFPISFSVLCTTTSTYEVISLINPTIAGTDQASWVSIPNSSLQYDISRTNANFLSFNSGQVLSSRFDNSATTVTNQDIANFWSIGSSITGVMDQFVLAVANIGTANRTESYYASINFKEIL